MLQCVRVCINRYGEVFKRIEWKKEESDPIPKAGKKITKQKKGRDAKDKMTEKMGPSEAEHAEEIFDPLRKTPERGKSRNRMRHTPEGRSKSRMTSDSKKNREVSSATDFQQNKSSHNRSSRGHATSLCSVEAISLMCDDESTTDKLGFLRRYYNEKYKSDLNVVDSDWIDETREKERKHLHNILTGETDTKASQTKMKNEKKSLELNKNLLISRQRRLKKLKKEKKEKARQEKENEESSGPSIQQPTFFVNVDSGQVKEATPTIGLTKVKSALNATPITLTTQPSMHAGVCRYFNIFYFYKIFYYKNWRFLQVQK